MILDYEDCIFTYTRTKISSQDENEDNFLVNYNCWKTYTLIFGAVVSNYIYTCINKSASSRPAMLCLQVCTLFKMLICCVKKCQKLLKTTDIIMCLTRKKQ